MIKGMASSTLPANADLHLHSSTRQTLELLAEYFCLPTNQVAELLRGATYDHDARRSSRRTLQRLHVAGLVHRIPYFDLSRDRGGMTYAYGLTDKGVEFCKSLWPLCKTFDDHSQRTLDHELEISYFHIALKNFATRNNLKLDWQQSDLKHTVSPDAMFGLTDPRKPKGKNTLYYFLEIERAKIGHYIKGEPSITRKLQKYYDYYNSDACEKEWLAFRQFRVIVIQRTEERRNNLLNELTASLNHRMFWLASEGAYKADIGGRIFATPKDHTSDNNYSFLEA